MTDADNEQIKTPHTTCKCLTIRQKILIKTYVVTFKHNKIKYRIKFKNMHCYS